MRSSSNSETVVKRPLRSLVVEDQEDDAMLLLNLLRRNGFNVMHERVDTIPALEDALLRQWDIVFSDHSMPSMNGMQALRLVRKLNPDVPFIFVSGTIGEDVAVEAMRTGAQDYIMKDNLARLVPAVRRELHDALVRKERRKAEQRLQFLARYDQLTGLPNRFHFLEYLAGAMNRNTDSAKLLGVIYIDLDRFKTINDSLGYEAGNLLLQEVGKRLKKCMDETGLVARMATDEFALVGEDFSNRGQIQAWVQKTVQCLDEPYLIRNCSMYFSASIGVAVYPEDATEAAELLGKADIATYRTKADGGRGYQFFEPTMAVHLEERLALERNMRLGMERGEFYLQYQPQMELTSGRIVGMEALIRWNSAERGLISPASFIPLAEETGFILPLSEWVMNQVCRQIQSWRAAKLPPIRVAVNVSARQFHDESLPGLIAQLLADYGILPDYLELEITESTIIRDSTKAIKILEEIKSLGIKVALDDFGTGYSSLAYLKTFKTDYLKIDQSFIRELTEDKGSQAIVSAITAMAEKLSLKTIAEGVETQAQFDLLKQQGCDMVQGYFIGRPTNAENIQRLLHSRQRVA